MPPRPMYRLGHISSPSPPAMTTYCHFLWLCEDLGDLPKVSQRQKGPSIFVDEPNLLWIYSSWPLLITGPFPSGPFTRGTIDCSSINATAVRTFHFQCLPVHFHTHSSLYVPGNFVSLELRITSRLLYVRSENQTFFSNSK
jgi:hypothetical protein